jgi:hypothetical protein
LELYTCDRLKDRNGGLIPTILAKPLLESRAQEIAVGTLKDEDRLLLNIQQWPGQSIAARAVELGLYMKDGRPYRSKVDRLLKRLENQKLITRLRDIWEITAKGKRAIEIIQNGPSGSREEGSDVPLQLYQTQVAVPLYRYSVPRRYHCGTAALRL